MKDYSIDKIAGEFDELKINHGTREKLMPFLEALRNYHESTFEHSVRVADLGKQIAEFTHITEPKTLWLPGLVHDIGKLDIPLELLNKKIGWTKKDAESMKKHVELGCSLLSGVADFSALVTFYSHYFNKENSYPSDKEFIEIFGETYHGWSKASIEKGRYCGRLVSLADTYDATKTREDDKFSPGKARLLSSGEAEIIFLKSNPDQLFLIRQLYSAGIFRGKD